MSASRNRETVRRLFDAINERDLDTMSSIVAAELRDAYLQGMQGMFDAFPDFRGEILAVVAEGDLVAARFRNTGTHEGELMGIPASGRRLDLEGCAFYRFDENGAVVEAWRFQDSLAFRQQLGAV